MRTVRRFVVLAVCLALVSVIAGCSSGGSSGGGGTTGGTGTTAGPTVVEQDFAFDPGSLEVKVGDTVTFTNEDSAPHNVSIDGKNLGDQNQGDSVTWTAEKVGDFPYTCTIHPSMTGTIVVK